MTVNAVTARLRFCSDSRDVQIAARHAEPRTTMRSDRAGKTLDRHPNCILAAYIASRTQRSTRGFADERALKKQLGILFWGHNPSTPLPARAVNASVHRGDTKKQ